MTTEPTDDEEVAAYVDGELAPDRRAALDARAVADPRLARRLMDEAALVAAIRGAQPPVPRHPPARLAEARRLNRALRARRWRPVVGRVAAALAFTAFGWTLHGLVPASRSTTSVADATFVDGAREALRVATIDTGPQPSDEPISRKIDRLEAVTDVLMPQLPSNWVVRSVQVQPFEGKPSVVVVAVSPVLGPVTLVAAPMETDTVVPPTPVGDDTVPTVTWQIGGTAYALMGSAAPTRLKSVADGIEVASRRKAVSKIRG